MVERKLESLLSSSSSSVVFAREQRDHPNGARCHPGWINCMKSILSTTRTTQSDIGVHLDRNLVHPCVAATLSEFQSVLKEKFNKLATTTTKSIHKWEKYFAIRFSCEISFDSKWKFGGFGAFAKWVQAYHIWLRTIQQDTADIESRALNRTQKKYFRFSGVRISFLRVSFGTAERGKSKYCVQNITCFCRGYRIFANKIPTNKNQIVNTIFFVTNVIRFELNGRRGKINLFVCILMDFQINQAAKWKTQKSAEE